jgi:hypothetical protein
MKTVLIQILTNATLVGVLVPATALTTAESARAQRADEARAIAKGTFIYGFPMVAAYQTLYKQADDKDSPDFKATFNPMGNVGDVATLALTSIITPPDTPYSYGPPNDE